ncbi:MAG TPA: 23S rRNA (uracil(1939)-C(5))-methyltransferase RlmD [Edaphobacter sp.]|nr:23S rRNA (uracil(1939)-C(5))-methyltransferase RlmD [Edaphobacter sp.]
MKLLIEKIVYGGNGLAHIQEGADAGGAVFVPFTLPGEQIEAEVTEERGSFYEAGLARVITPSPNRVVPRCVHFGVCGGCHLQHASYSAQLELKRAILQETMERAGLDAVPAIEIHSAEPWGYRNRIRLRVAVVEGDLRVGYLQRGSSQFLPVQMCPIAAPVLWRAAEAFLHLDENFKQWSRAAEEIELFTNGDEEKVQMTLFVQTQPAKGFAEFCEALRQRLPELAGAGVQVMESSGRGRKSLRVRPGAAWGAAGLNYTVAGETYWVSRRSFFQVNRFLVDELVELTTAGRSGKLAWDLYAGAGLFSRVLAKRFPEVVSVEAAEGDLAVNLRGAGRRNVTATTTEFLRQAALERDRPDLVVMDPPRAGVGAEVCALLVRLKPREIVYVSCDPATLGRDLRAMVDSGYRLNRLHLVDMFPETFHQETVAVLGR